MSESERYRTAAGRAAAQISVNLTQVAWTTRHFETALHPPEGLNMMLPGVVLLALDDSLTMRARGIIEFLMKPTARVVQGRRNMHWSLFTDDWQLAADDGALGSRLEAARLRADQHVAHLLERVDVSGGRHLRAPAEDLVVAVSRFAEHLQAQGSEHASTFASAVFQARSALAAQDTLSVIDPFDVPSAAPRKDASLQEYGPDD